MPPRCDYCGGDIVGQAVCSTLGAFCSHTCSLAAVAEGIDAKLSRAAGQGVKRVASRVIATNGITKPEINPKLFSA